MNPVPALLAVAAILCGGYGLRELLREGEVKEVREPAAREPNAVFGLVDRIRRAGLEEALAP